MESARVLYICGGRSFRKERLNRKLAEVAHCWRDVGHEVMHLCGGDLLNSDAMKTDYGSQEYHTRWYKRLPGMSVLLHSVSEWKDMRHDRIVLKKLESVVKKWQPDIVWERSSRLHNGGLKFAKATGVPYVLEWKDNLVMYRCSLFRRRALDMEKRKKREADYVVVESQVLLEKMALEGVERNKIIVAHNAVDATQFGRDEKARYHTRRAVGIQKDEVLVGYMGSYAFYHDAARFVLAADILQKKGVKKMKFLMVGAGKEYPETRRMALQRGLLDTILTMKPGVPPDDVPGILSALDIAVLPGSTDIICPIKIQEYMAAELATVAPDYACNREVISDGVTGMLFEPKNENSLAEKILLLAKDNEIRTLLGQQARREVLRRFTWEKTWGAALEKVWNKISKFEFAISILLN